MVSDTDCQRYQRGNFVARLAPGYRYTPGHAWLSPDPVAAGHWRVGLTPFALRMLGELVELQFAIRPGDTVEPGDILGSLEGFKAVSDLYCSGRGVFRGGNPGLAAGLDPVAADPCGGGWLYGFEGEPAPGTLDVDGYRELLDQTIDRLRAAEPAEEDSLA